MKTALTQLIERLKELRDLHPIDGGLSQRTQRGKYVFAILEAEKLLEKEKQQIIEACIKTTQDCWISNAEAFGLDLVFTEEDLKNQIEEAEQYYNETFS